MKKVFVFALALITVLSMSLASCKKENTPNVTNDDDGDFVVRTDTSGNTGITGTGTGTSGSTTTSAVWTDKNDEVYVLGLSNVRGSASPSGNLLGQVSMGTKLTRIASNGTWEKISYNGSEAYIRSYLVTTSQAEVTFTEVEKKAIHITVGANADKPIQINLRTSPIYDAALGDQNVGISGLTNKQTANGELQVVAINGTRTWLKVEFNGKDASGNDKSGTFYCRLTYIEEYKNSSGGAGGMG